MATDPEVVIEGLDGFRKGLRKIDASYSKKLGQINKRAAEKVAADAVSRYAQSRYTPRSGKAQRSIRASAAASAAQVKLGSARAPYVVGQEFGSNNRKPVKSPKRGSPHASALQFRPWTGKGPGGAGSEGRFLYPAVRAETPKLVEAYLKELDGLSREAFPKGKAF